MTGSEFVFTLGVWYIVSVGTRDINITMTGSEFVERGSSIKLSCNATGGDYPPAEIDWFKDGNKLTSDARKGLTTTKVYSINKKFISSTLIIKHAGVMDAGTYVCRTSNLQVTSMKVNVLNAETVNKKRRTQEEQRYGIYEETKDSSSCNQTLNSWLILILVLYHLFLNRR